jgi:hypothetical protein
MSLPGRASFDSPAGLPEGRPGPGRRVPSDALAALPACWGLALIGGLALVVGMLVYATDRDPARALLFPAFATLSAAPAFGALGGWLPSFVHPFGFGLLTAAALPRSARPAYGACAAWWAVNVAFEFAQHTRFSGALADTLHHVFGHGGVSDAFANYALHGRFDRADLVAATAGSLAAAAVLRHVHRRRDRHAQ